jgi:glycosyltransferase involved in cell wall biosynthesis
MSEIQKKAVVMQILPALENGGVERGTIDIAKALKKEGFEPIVVSKGGILVYQLKEAKINHIQLDVGTKNPLKIYANIKKISQIITENSVDIVHVRSRAPMWSAYFACKQTNTKLVATVHGTYSVKFLFWKNFAPKRIYNAIMLKADRIIVVSDFIKNYLIENYQNKIPNFPLDKISVIQRGADLGYFNLSKVSKNRIIDLSKKWHLPDDKKIILMPARFTEWKGHEFLIESLSKVRHNFLCLMVGSDHGHKAFRKKIENKIIQLDLQGRVKIAGVSKDMPVLYAISHLVVCPSVRPEAFGRIAIEAQAMQRPIISTKIGGSLETVIDGQTGFLVDVGDTAKMAELIDHVLDLSDERSAEIGAAGHENVRTKFSNEKMCDSTLEVYRSIIESSNSLQEIH